MQGLGIVFTPGGLSVELRESGSRVALRRSGNWELEGASVGATLSVCLFEWAEMEYFLRTPFFRTL